MNVYHNIKRLMINFLQNKNYEFQGQISTRNLLEMYLLRVCERDATLGRPRYSARVLY